VGQLKSPDVAAWMDAADIFCLPSHSEGCPNVVLEALSCGCPVVASNVGGIPEIAPPGGSILIPPHEPDQLAAALRKALARRWDRHEIARLFARSWDQVAAETYQVCENVVNRSAARGQVGRTGPGTRKRLKITVITSYFPIAAEPYRGHSAYHTLRRMQKMADIEVICPMAVYPRAKWLNPRGFRYHRPDLSYSPPDMQATYLEYPVLPFVTRPINGLTCAHYLKPYLQASRPDLILNYWIYPDGFSAVRLGREMGVPVIVGSIGSDIRRPGDPVSTHLMRKTLLDATGVITVSEELRRRAIELGVVPDKVTTVLNGCDFDVFHPRDRAAERRQAGIDTDTELVLYVGWLSPTKGLAELMDAMIALGAKRPRLRLALVGEGSYRQPLADKARTAGIADRVQFLGRMDSEGVSRWLGISNVFCLPSYSEGCPNAVVEAIASGRPVVATDVGGIPELVRNGCGMLVPPMDTTRLQEALERALSTTWDEAGISKHFGRSWESAAEETYEFCRRLAGIKNK
jgi:glycosyltransferase involved in cell wall biosynthesis